jgi:hypothetical protein
MDFKRWLEEQQCAVFVYQEDDGSGFYCAIVTTPDGEEHDITVQTA